MATQGPMQPRAELSTGHAGLLARVGTIKRRAVYSPLSPARSAGEEEWSLAHHAPYRA